MSNSNSVHGDTGDSILTGRYGDDVKLLKWIVAAFIVMTIYGWMGGGVRSDPCMEAKTARDIAASSTGDKRTTALMEAFVQQEKCDAGR